MKSEVKVMEVKVIESCHSRFDTWAFSLKYARVRMFFINVSKNVLQLLYIIAHEIIISNTVSEYTQGRWKVNDAYGLLMSCI